jgi:hypothetical protein
MRRSWLLLASALLGLVLGPALDQIHVQTDTLVYAHPWWLDQAWWVGPQFALAFVAITVGVLAIDRSTAPAPGPGWVASATALFVVAYLVTGFGHRHEWLVFGVLFAGLALRMFAARNEPDPTLPRAAVMLAIGGAGYEALLSSLPGTFEYTVASLGPVPVWLPVLYMHATAAAVGMVRVGRANSS